MDSLILWFANMQAARISVPGYLLAILLFQLETFEERRGKHDLKFICPRLQVLLDRHSTLDKGVNGAGNQHSSVINHLLEGKGLYAYLRMGCPFCVGYCIVRCAEGNANAVSDGTYQRHISIRIQPFEYKIDIGFFEHGRRHVELGLERPIRLADPCAIAAVR